MNERRPRPQNNWVAHRLGYWLAENVWSEFREAHARNLTHGKASFGGDSALGPLLDRLPPDAESAGQFCLPTSELNSPLRRCNGFAHARHPSKIQPQSKPALPASDA